MVENVKDKLGDYAVIINSCILPLGRLPHIVLGVQWLYTLGEVTSNYKNMEMKFKFQGKEMILCGMKDQEEQRAWFQRMEVIRKRKLECIGPKGNFEDKEDQEDFVVVMDILNFFKASNLGGETL